jgi:hypothetical protein
MTDKPEEQLEFFVQRWDDAKFGWVAVTAPKPRNQAEVEFANILADVPVDRRNFVRLRSANR